MENLNENVLNEQIGEFDPKALKFLQLNSRKEDLNEFKNQMLAQQKFLLNDDKILDILDERIKDLTIEQLKTMPDEEINKIFVIDGEEIKLNVEKGKEVEFKRDFLVYKKTSLETFKEIDVAIEKFEKEIQDELDEFNETIKKYGDISGYLRASIVEKIEKAPDEEKKQKYQTILENFDNAFNFDNVYEFIKEYGPERVLKEYNYKSFVTIDTFDRTVAKLNLENFAITNIHKDIESKYLPEKYQQNPELFIFCIMKYIAYQRFELDRSKEGVFLSQLNINLKKLTYNKFSDEEKEKFIGNITRVLDLFYN